MKTFWTVVIVIIALAVVGYGGYRIYHHFTWKQATAQPVATQTQVMKPQPTAMMEKSSVYKMVSDPKLGTILKDPKGKTLYTFVKDKTGVSNCTGDCLKLWPQYNAQSQTGSSSANISIIKRTDGTFQYAWKGMPLYYYSKDKDSNDTYGNGVASLWSVVK